HSARSQRPSYPSLEMLLEGSCPAAASVQVPTPSKTVLRVAEMDFPRCSPFPAMFVGLLPAAAALSPSRWVPAPARERRQHLRRRRKGLVQVFAAGVRGRRSWRWELELGSWSFKNLI